MKMEKATITFVLALVSLADIFVTSDACEDVPSMAMDVACLKACNTSMYRLCRTTLRQAPPTAEVTNYALVAASFAKQSYESTMDAADRLLNNPSLPDGERAATTSCKDKYEKAHTLMLGVVNQLNVCSFAYARQEYVDAMVSVVSCGDELSVYQSSPLYAMNAADQNQTMIAYDLGALIVGK